MTGMNYTKQAIDYPQIIGQLKERGLVFCDEALALRELRNISYFRISNYLRYFEVEGEGHIYRAGSRFEDALSVYYFDKRLRSLLFTAIQSVEIALRSKVIHYVALRHGPFWFANPDLCFDMAMFSDNLNSIKREVRRSKEDFIQEHFQKYASPEFPPVWKTLEVVSFGVLSKLYCNLNDNLVKKQIAREFNLPNHIILESWIKCIVLLRNYIAHHVRIWNKRFPRMPQIATLRLRGAWIECVNIRSVKPYATLCCLAYLQNNIHPNNNFAQQLKSLIGAYPTIDLRAMGFPWGWEGEPLWN